MKKITTLFSLLVFITFGWQHANAQFTEDFEGTFLPVNWSKDTYDAANDITQSTSENHTPSDEQYTGKLEPWKTSFCCRLEGNFK